MPRSIRLKRKREANRAISVDRKGLLELIENLLRKKQPRGILQGNPKNVSKKILKNAYSNNPHGLGVMYFDNDSRLIQD